MIQIELVLLTRLIQKKIETVIDLNDIPKQPWKTKRNATTGFENVYADKSSAYAQYGPCGKQVIRININKALNELRDEYVINDKGMQLITTYCCAHILAKCLCFHAVLRKLDISRGFNFANGFRQNFRVY